MLIPIAVVIVTLASSLIAFRRIIFPVMEKKRMNKFLMKEGVEAEATLLYMEETGLFVNKLPQVKLQLKVQPSKGRNFVAETKEILSFIDLSQLKVGGTVHVKYNPLNVKEVMILRQSA